MVAVSNKDIQIQIPQNAYYVPRHKQGHQLSNSDDHIIEKKPTTGLKIGAHKLQNSFTTYFPKGMSGSVNSNFYEFLATGVVPYIVGSGTLIALSGAANKFFGTQDTFAANKGFKNMAAGVVLYGVGKWLGGKVLNKLAHASTGIDLEMPYKKVVTELPEGPNEKEKVREEFHRVFESKDFFRHDLLVKQGEAQGNRYAYYDKITKKMGYKDRLNAPDQVVNDKIRETIVKTTVGKYISSYLWAAVGVAIGSQACIAEFKPRKGANLGKTIKNFGVDVFKTAKSAAKDFYRGKGLKAEVRGMGKVLLFTAIGATVVSWLNVALGFGKGKVQGKSAVDFKKDYEGV